jgi:hypothetical protein
MAHLFFTRHMIKNCFQLSHSLTMLFYVVCISEANAQKNPGKFSFAAEAGIRASYGMRGGGLSAWAYRGFGRQQKFLVGLGIRHTSHFSNNRDFITAPARFTSDEKNLDTLMLSGSIHSLNLALDLRYRLNSTFALGFNIDLLGLSIGPKQKGKLKEFTAMAEPTKFNFLLVDDNDIGTINSEFYLTCAFSEHLAGKLAFSYLYTEFTTNKKYIAGIDNNRYRNKSMGLALGLQYRF